MTTPFVLVKSYKSAGIAILLTLLFGPVGLFYASVTAGLTMTFIIPVLLVIFILLVGSQGQSLLEFSIIVTLLIIAFYWLICILWAIVAVSEYNRKIEEEYSRQQAMLNDIKHSAATKVQSATLDTDNMQTGYSTNTGKPSMQEWMKQNPGKGINDYFIKFGT